MTAQRKYLSGDKYYVPALAAMGDIASFPRAVLNFGAVIVTDPDGILDGESINAAVDTTTFASTYSSNDVTMGPWGRNLVVVASGAATSNVTVYGRDYLGQKMAESFTLNGTTTVTGKKAFKYVDRITAGATSSVTIDLGFGTKFGLPYATTTVLREWADEVVASAGTLTAAVLTDPQTTTTGDPRGLYVPTTTPNSSKIIKAEFEFTNYVNSSDNGGLHGIAHVAA